MRPLDWRRGLLCFHPTPSLAASTAEEEDGSDGFNQPVLVFTPALVELEWIVVFRSLLLHTAETPFLLLYPTTDVTARGQALEGSEGFSLSTKSREQHMVSM